MVGIFNRSIFNKAIFNTDPVGVVDNGWLGGGLGDYYPWTPGGTVKKKTLQEDIIKVETSLIDLRQKAQEARLKELTLQRRQDQKARQELARMEAETRFLHQQIQFEQRRLLHLQNDLALLVLLMCNPFLSVMR